MEAFFLCLFLDNPVSYVSYRNILYGHYELYKTNKFIVMHNYNINRRFHCQVKVCDEYA